MTPGGHTIDREICIMLTTTVGVVLFQAGCGGAGGLEWTHTHTKHYGYNLYNTSIMVK